MNLRIIIRICGFLANGRAMPCNLFLRIFLRYASDKSLKKGFPLLSLSHFSFPFQNSIFATCQENSFYKFPQKPQPMTNC